MKIVCSLHNGNKGAYKEITLRKFYLVAFWEKDLKTFNIYTAIVAGSLEGDKRLPLNSDLDLRVQFSVADGKKKSIDFIDKNSSFGKDNKAWTAVWGEKTVEVTGPDTCKEWYNKFFTPKINKVEIDSLVHYLALSSNNNRKDYESIAIVEKYTKYTDDTYLIKPSISGQENFEIANFTLTRVEFKDQDSYDLNFEICFDNGMNCIDNSIYFVIPHDYETKDKNLFYRQENRDIHASDPFQVPDKNRSNYIQEWIVKGIVDRHYFRIHDYDSDRQDNFFKSFKATDNIASYQVYFRISNSINPLISQFLYGLFVALFFTYGLDQTRLMHFRENFAYHLKISPDVNFFTTYTFLFIAILFKISLGQIRENPLSFWVRFLAIPVSLFWFVWIYAICGVRFYNNYTCFSYYDYFTPDQLQISHLFNKLSFCLNLFSLIFIFLFHNSEISYCFSIKNFLKKGWDEFLQQGIIIKNKCLALLNSCRAKRPTRSTPDH